MKSINVCVAALLATLLLSFVNPAVTLADEIITINPCRVVDTRNTSAGYLSPGTTLNFSVRTAPNNPGAPQGGESNCGVPYNSTSVVLSVVAVSPSSNGHANLWAFGQSMPLASILNVTTLETENVGTFGLLSSTGSSADLSLRNSGFSTYWVIDILGYTVPSTATLVGQAIGVTFSGTTLIVKTAGGLSVKVFAPDSMSTFKASWMSVIDDAVDNCVHIDGLWHHATSTIEYDTVEARSLPIVMAGYCGPDES